jgi:cytochrome c biogenesis protein CcdA
MVIGMHYRKPKDPLESSQHKPLLFKLIISAFVSGFLVSILEAVCTGQLYLPTITFIFKTTPLRFRAFLYLILYNAMFVVPLLAVFLFAFFGVTSNQFAQFIKKHMLSIKFIMAIIFIGLGIFLIWRV